MDRVAWNTDLGSSRKKTGRKKRKKERNSFDELFSPLSSSKWNFFLPSQTNCRFIHIIKRLNVFPRQATKRDAECMQSILLHLELLCSQIREENQQSESPVFAETLNKFRLPFQRNWKVQWLCCSNDSRGGQARPETLASVICWENRFFSLFSSTHPR